MQPFHSPSGHDRPGSACHWFTEQASGPCSVLIYAGPRPLQRWEYRHKEYNGRLIVSYVLISHQ